jgi:hypothetical protein
MIDPRRHRYLRKMRELCWGGGEKHVARVNDLLARIKAKLQELEHWLGDRDLARGEENGV